MARVDKRYRLFLTVVCAWLCLSGCSSRDLYNAVQQNRLQECRKLYGSQRADCEARYQKDYDIYERERQDVRNKDNP